MESINSFSQIENKTASTLLNYCRKFRVGLINLLSDASVRPSRYLINEVEFRIDLVDSKQINNCVYDHIDESFFKLTKFTKREVFINKGETNFKLPVISAKNDGSYLLRCNKDRNMMMKTTRGNIRQIFIAPNWRQLPVLTTLLLDGLVYASYGRIEIETERYIQIDIDDVFVGAIKSRMKRVDVQALVEFQNNFLNKRHFNSSRYEFKFNLGYSGYYYQHGNTEENLADEMLISM